MLAPGETSEVVTYLKKSMVVSREGKLQPDPIYIGCFYPFEHNSNHNYAKLSYNYAKLPDNYAKLSHSYAKLTKVRNSSLDREDCQENL